MTEPTGPPVVAATAPDATSEPAAADATATATSDLTSDVASDDNDEATAAGSTRIRRRARVGPVVPPPRTAPEAVPVVLDPDDEPLSPVASVISYTAFSGDAAEDDTELADSSAPSAIARRGTADLAETGAESGGPAPERRFGRARGRRPPEVADRALRGLVTTRGTQVSWSSATRARLVSAPTAEDIAAAEQEVVVVRRHYTPREPLPTRGNHPSGTPTPGPSSVTPGPGAGPVPGPTPAPAGAPGSSAGPGGKPGDGASGDAKGGREPGRSRVRFTRRQPPPPS